MRDQDRVFFFSFFNGLELYINTLGNILMEKEKVIHERDRGELL